MQSQEIKGYKSLMKKHEVKKPLFKSFSAAFLFGGGLCAAAQFIFNLFVRYGGWQHDQAAGIVLVIVIAVTTLVTALGYYDNLGQIAGAGLAVPISGFANSMVCAAIDDRSEGIVQGVATGSFKLAGAVIVFGCVSAFIVGIIYWLGGLLGFL